MAWGMGKLELFFNELSIDGKQSISGESVKVLVNAYRLLNKYGITTCRIDSADNLKLLQMIQNMPDSFNIKNFYFAFFRSPYESETVEKEQEEYLTHAWSYQGKPCIGLALASVLNSVGFSIYGIDWDVAFVQLMKDDDIDTVKHICTEKQIDIHIPEIQLKKGTELVKTDLLAEDKKISLRHDHGMEVLIEFSKRLTRCPYVVAIINSLPYNSFERKFIRKVRDNGLIEIVLPWTDKHYGIVVKTTGRNMDETKRIGEIINERYGGI